MIQYDQAKELSPEVWLLCIVHVCI
jgi:hypothetical protein